jgi:hypothetical protein
MDQQSKTFAFIGIVFLTVMGMCTYLIAIGKVDPSAFLQFGGMVIAATAGLLAPSPLSKPNTP